MLIDTHAHLDFSEDKEGWIARAKADGVTKIICVGTSVEASRRSAELAEQFSDAELRIWATVGIHAQDGKDDIEKYGSLNRCMDELKKIAKSRFKKSVILKRSSAMQNEAIESHSEEEILSRSLPLQDDNNRVVGVGECGYDIHLKQETLNNKQSFSANKPETTKEEREFQRELFEAQIRLAAELKLPLIIHCRNAWKETFELLSKYRLSFPRKRESSSGFPIRSGMTGGTRGVFHSWTGDWEAAKKALDLGFYISFSGIVTFKNAPIVQEVAKKMPIERMLLETDSPFLSPEPFRGKQNEPKNVRIVAEFVAKLRNLPLSEICDITSQNAERLFRF